MRTTLLPLIAALGLTTAKNTVPSLWDGACTYPTPDAGFTLDSYLGRWYQVAGTIAPFTRNCKCIFAQYALNDNGTVQVNNTCQAGTRPVNILGTATPVGPEYGTKGAFQVQFPGERPPDCPGPNYIVQGEFLSLAFKDK
jgi:apolipoprotein D and lipocalin family protein